MLIKELRNCAHVFTLNDDTTFRIFALETKKINSGKVSEEILEAQRRGSVVLIEDTVNTKVKSKKEVQRNG